MKRTLVVVLVLAVTLCTVPVSAESILKVGATPVPHAEILHMIVPILKEEGITLEIVEFTDYVRPNLALQEGELDANFFQHLPYLESFNQDARTDLVSLVGVHVEPLGVYATKHTSLDDLPSRATLAIPNDATNGGRALLLLQEAGLIKLDPKTGITPTIFDVEENPRNIRFIELEAAQLSRSLADVDAAVINGNYALQAGLNPVLDSLFLEGANSPYVNIVAIRAADVEDSNLAKLALALSSEQVRSFILETYEGAVVPVF